MKKKLVFRTAKLLSDSRKRGTETGVAVAYEHQPKDQEEKKHGSLFAVIEISGPTGSSEEIVEMIIDAFHNEYYKDVDKEPLESFENSLSKVNEELANITENGKIHWLGKLNAILGVLQDRTLHITQAGSAEAYLFRKENMAHISKDLAGDNINPLRTFINIASGELDEDDKLGFFTPGIFFHISKDELKKYITEFNPNTAISHLANLLEGLNGQRRSSALIIEMLTPEGLANYTIDSAPEEVWVQESKNGVEAITKGVSPIVLTAAKKSAGFLGSTFYFIKTTAIPVIISTISSLISGIQNLIGKTQKKENVFLKPKEAISPTRFEDAGMETTPLKPETETSGQTEDKPLLTEKPERSSLVFSTFNKFSTGAKGGAKKTGQMLKLPKNQNFKTIGIIVVASILVLGTIFSVSSKIKAKAAQSSEKVFAEANNKYDEGSNLIAAGNKEKGLESLEESKTLAEKAKNTKKYKKEAEELLSKINSKKEQALGIVMFTEQPLADLDKEKATGLLGIQEIGEKLYSINSNTGAVYEISLKGETKEILEKYEFTGKPIAATAVEETNKIVLLTDEPALYEFDPKEKDFTKLKVSGELKKGKDLISFGSNIYILNPEDKAVYKHLKITGGYGQKSNYIKDATNSNVSGGISLATDGNMYILSEDGKITKYASGSQKEFEIKGLPEKLSGSKIYASTETKGFWILDKGKKSIVVLDENYNFVKQIRNDSFADLKGMYIGKDKAVYVLSGTKIFKINQ